MRAVLLLALLPLVSCGVTRVEYGYGEPWGPGAGLNTKGSGQPIDLHYLAVKQGYRVYERPLVASDLFVGGFLVLPEEHETGLGGGAMLSPRLLYNKYTIKPFLSIDLGIGAFDWESQAAGVNFLVGGGPGVLFPLGDSTALTLSYTLLHVSNAGLKDPNPGLNSDLIMVGLEYKF